MKRSSYGKHDYAFGQMMLTLRTHIGLTQAGLADRLGVSRRAVSEWEAGSTYPKAAHLQQLIALGVQQQAFPSGREAEEIRTLWQAAHQKLLLDEAWLAALLAHSHPALTFLPPAPHAEHRPGKGSSAQPLLERRVDWGEALAVPSFYGREQELDTLTAWLVQERCRVVSVLGMGGIGKSALAVTLMHQLAPHFEVVLWRSLRDAPTCEELLEDCLKRLTPQPLQEMPATLEQRVGLLLEYFRSQRALLVLDNLELLLEEGEGMGRMRAGYQDYERLLRRVAQTEHQSCLLLTSREKPRGLAALEGSHTPVRALRLSGLDAMASEQLLLEKDVAGTTPDRQRLIARYGGNPLALKIVAETIVELFDGEIAPFLAGDEMVFGSVRELLDEQFARLSAVEQTVLLWLAILREPVSIEELLRVLATMLTRAQVLEAVEALRRRSVIERGKRRGSFTLQSVVLEYVTGRLIAEAVHEIEEGQLARLIEHRLAPANVKEYVRQTQQRLIVAPLLAHLRQVYRGREEVEQRLLWLLDRLRDLADYAQGYGPANVISLLRVQRGHLRGLDLSHLVIRGSYLQGVEMQDTSLVGATLQECVFTETFDAIRAVAISPDGQYWATAGRRGEVRVWEVQQATVPTLHRVWQAHIDRTDALAFSPDGRLLASGSWDNTLKLWDLESGALRWSSRHPKGIHSVAFNPDGSLLATGGSDATLRLWDLKLGIQVQTLSHPSRVLSVAWSPDGHLLASGDLDGQIRLWEIVQSRPAVCVRTLAGHNRVLRLAFAPDGRTLASAGLDWIVKLWDVGQEGSLSLRQTLSGHSALVYTLAWSPDGRMLASGSLDHTIWLWDVEGSRARTTLLGHTAIVHGLAFTPDSRSLLSGSDDGTLRLWDVQRGETLRILQGYAVALYDVDWSPDGTRIASAGSDCMVSIWELERSKPPDVLHGHSWVVYSVAWSPDGRLLASSGWDNVIYLWDASTGKARQTLRDPGHVATLFFGVAWSPDGKWLANANSPLEVQVWEMTTGSAQSSWHQLSTWVRRLAWSPDSTRLAGGGDDGQVYVWDGSDGTLLQRLERHHGIVTNVAWSPDGKRLASAGGSGGSGELVVWDVQSRERLYTWNEPSAMINALAWDASGAMVVSGDGDGMLRWWDLQHGECVHVRKAHQGAVQSIKSSPDGRKLASCGDDGAITLWDLQSGEHLRTLRRDRPYERLDISGVKGLVEAQRATLRALGAIENR